MAHNNLNEISRNEIRTTGGFDLIIDAGKTINNFIYMLFLIKSSQFNYTRFIK